MRISFIIPVLFLIPCSALAAGTCPVGLPYTLSAGCYFVAANGSDSNDGLSEASGHPWLHAPGMPNCASACATVSTALSNTPQNVGIILRGGDTWHFGNSGLSPYTGGIWSFPFGAYATCNYQAVQTGCIYFGVDQNWFTGGSWQRPILTGDNPTSTSLVASCAHTTGATDNLVVLAPGTIFDSFEMTGFCVSNLSPGFQDSTYLVYSGTGNAGTGTAFIQNDYFHGWTATTGTASASGLVCTVIGGGNNGLQVLDHVVVDGSDSDSQVCAWGTFPSFYHFKDSYIGHTTQGVGQWCHDIHDNIFEFFDNPYVATHGNIIECNDNSNGTAAFQPQNTPNVVYNNIVRHATTAFSTAGQVVFWFCPESVPEYYFNNIIYDVGNSNFWAMAGEPNYTCNASGTGRQFLFNNTLVDGTQPCRTFGSVIGSYITVSNEHLINTPFGNPGSGSDCVGDGAPSNIAMTDAVAITQGYGTNTGRINTQNSSINCAHDTTFPCSPTLPTNATVGTGVNEQSYCTALAAFTSEPAIGTDAANACKHDTTDGCIYNQTSHTMSCPARTTLARP